ncbi:MAG TPA: glycine--tRNA ligase subunit beta, partial [Nitrospira sp.]|nr:glycine--tRNA ligase subunit beta [Nitrospira sp.]
MTRSSREKRKHAGAKAPRTAEFLLEIGTEELPYYFIPPALGSLKQEAEQALTEARLAHAAVRTFGTPRRLTLVVDGLALHQSSIVKEAIGPSRAVAYDSSGQPTKAAVGFAAGQGVPVESLQIRQTPKGEYVFAVKPDEGRTARAVLQELVPALVGKLSFPKSMKWNDLGVRFARPVRWLVALLGGSVLPMHVAGIKAGNRTYGHRVKGAGRPIAVRDFASYEAALSRAGVLVDQARRREVIESQLRMLCSKAGVGLIMDNALLEQAVYTTEWPFAVMGNFKLEYLAVPPEILITSMKEHQGFFSVRNKTTGQLAPHFIAVTNSELKDMSLIRAGNERVLAARLADAKFFFDEDRKTPLEARVKKLEGVTFHQKLGTMAQKQERIRQLARAIAERLSESQEVVDSSERAASLCKADLLTGIVGEFPELQGIMGGEYAKHGGESEAVAQAIREQYLPKALEGELPATLPGKILSLADRLDTLAAFFHVGMIPTGSEDPFALRRHGTAIVRLVLEGPLRLDLREWIDRARAAVSEAGFKPAPDTGSQGHSRLTEFLFDRVRHYGKTVHGLRDDVIDAVLESSRHRKIDLVDWLLKMKSLQAVTQRPEFDPLIIGFKRATRILDKERWDRKAVDPSLFKEPAERELFRQAEISRNEFDEQMKQDRYDGALNALVQLKPAIDSF